MGKGGRKSYANDVIDMVALVAIDTREIGYVSISEAKQTMQFRSKSLQGQYRGEENQKAKIKEMRQSGLSYGQIAKELNIDAGYAHRVVKGKEEKAVFGRYLSDFTFEKALECGKNYLP